MLSNGYIFALIAVSVIFYYWKNHLKKGPIYKSSVSLEGKTVIITGGNAGIGKATALECAKRKAHLIIASRNVEKSLAARKEIIEQTGHDDIKIMKLDLGDFDSVRDFACNVLASEQYIDFLVNNAALFAIPGLTKHGFSYGFGVNHLGHFLLTSLLLDRMKQHSATRPVRILNVSSGSYIKGSVNFERAAYVDNSDRDGFIEHFQLYRTTKLANIYFTTSLAQRTANSNIYAFSINPGPTFSDIGKSLPFGVSWLIGKLYTILLFRPVLYGCQTTMYCMLDEDVIRNSGDYFYNCNRCELTDLAKGNEVGAKLWCFSVKVLGPWLKK